MYVHIMCMFDGESGRAQERRSVINIGLNFVVINWKRSFESALCNINKNDVDLCEALQVLRISPITSEIIGFSRVRR